MACVVLNTKVSQVEVRLELEPDKFKSSLTSIWLTLLNNSADLSQRAMFELQDTMSILFENTSNRRNTASMLYYM
jgi:hypothetical protein